MENNPPSGEALEMAAQCWKDVETIGEIMNTALATAFAKRLDVLLAKVDKITVGDFTVINNDYADQTWIYRSSGEGMGLEKNTLAEFEKRIEAFYKEYL